MATFSMTMARPLVSSPLAESSPNSMRAPPAQRLAGPPKRNSAFAPSRALRPFASISHALQPSTKSSNAASKPIKLIQPPKNYKMSFVLDLTQAEFSRQE